MTPPPGAERPPAAHSSPPKGARVDRVVLGAILAGHVLLALAWVQVVPPWEGPDEPAHLLRVRQLACSLGWGAEEACGTTEMTPTFDVAPAEEGCASLPQSPLRQVGDWSREHLGSNYQAHHPPLGHLAYVPVFVANGPYQPLLFVDTRYDFSVAGVFLHDQDHDALRAQTDRLRLLRLTGALFGALTVALAWRCGRLLAPDRPAVALLAAAVAAFLPQFTFTAAYVNNDTVAAAGGGLLTVWVLAALAGRRSLTPGWLAVAGLLSAVALGARLNAVGLLPFVALSLAVLWARERPRWLPPVVLSVAAIAFLAAGWAAVSPAPWAEALRSRWLESPRLAIPEAIRSIGKSSVGWFGWMDVPLPSWAYGTAALLAAGLILLLASQRRARGVPAVLLGVAVISQAAFVVGDALRSGQAQGRYLFPALVPLAALAGLAVCGRLEAAHGRRLAGLLAVLLAGVNLLVLQGVVAPAFPVESGMLSTAVLDGGKVLVQHGRTRPGRAGFPPDPRGEVIVASPAELPLALNHLEVDGVPATLCRGSRELPRPWRILPGGSIVLRLPPGGERPSRVSWPGATRSDDDVARRLLHRGADGRPIHQE